VSAHRPALSVPEKNGLRTTSQSGFATTAAGAEHLVDLLGLPASHLREIRPSTTASADEGNLLHNLAGLDARGQIGRHRDDDLDLAVVLRRNDDDAALDLGFQ
jgi:hypothetical protein